MSRLTWQALQAQSVPPRYELQTLSQCMFSFSSFRGQPVLDLHLALYHSTSLLFIRLITHADHDHCQHALSSYRLHRPRLPLHPHLLRSNPARRRRLGTALPGVDVSGAEYQGQDCLEHCLCRTLSFAIRLGSQGNKYRRSGISAAIVARTGEAHGRTQSADWHRLPTLPSPTMARPNRSSP